MGEILMRAAAIVAIGLMVLSAARFVIVFSLAIQQTDAAATMAKLIFFFIPHYVGFMLPLSLYWSTFLAFRRLAASNEVVSFEACGISPLRSAMPLMALCAIFAATNAFVFGWLEPWARYQYRALKYKVVQSELYAGTQAQTFVKFDKRIVFVDQIDRSNASFQKFFLFEEKADGTQRTVTAPLGHFIESDQGIVLSIRDGHEIEVPPMSGGAAGAASAARYSNASSVDVPVFGAAKPYPPRGDDEQEYYLNELWTHMDAPPKGTTELEMSSEFHRKMVIILTSMVLPLLAMLIGRGFGRSAKLYRNVAAIVSGIVYYELVETGEVICKELDLAPTVYFWSVFMIALSVVAAWLTWINVVNRDPWDATMAYLRTRWPGATRGSRSHIHI